MFLNIRQVQILDNLQYITDKFGFLTFRFTDFKEMACFCLMEQTGMLMPSQGEKEEIKFSPKEK